MLDLFENVFRRAPQLWSTSPAALLLRFIKKEDTKSEVQCIRVGGSALYLLSALPLYSPTEFLVLRTWMHFSEINRIYNLLKALIARAFVFYSISVILLKVTTIAR